MASNYERYNQALQQEKQLNQVEEDIRPEVEKQVSEISQVENTYNKNLRSAVISNKQVDLRAANKDKKTISKAKQQAQAPLRELAAERSRLQQQKQSAVKTFSQLESQGYKKELRDGKIIYYREKTSSSVGTYRKEEYIFSADGTPIQIIKRDDFKEDDKRKVDEEEIVLFDSQGRVKNVETFDDGERDKETSFDFKSDGSLRVSTRDYEKERKLKEQTQKEYEAQLAEQRKYKQMTASVDLSGNSIYSETAWNPKTQQWEKTTTTYTKQTPNIPKVSTEKVLQATRTPTAETLFSQNLNIAGGVPGVNQGTDTSNIPTITIDNPFAPKPGEATISAPTQRTLTKEETTQMIVAAQRQKEYDEANSVKKFFMKDWSAESQRQRDKFDASGGYDTTALTYEIGAGFIAGAQGAGQLVRGLVTEPITTTTNIVTSIPKLPGAIAEKAKRNPGGLVGEVLFDVASGSLVAKGVTAARNTLRPATIIDDAPASIRTMVVDDTIKTDAIGNFQIESGLFKRTRDDFSFESSGTLERVKDFDIVNSPGSNFKQITETRVERLSDKPSGTSQTPRQITQQSSATDLADPIISARTKGSTTKSVDLDAAPTSKEIFRGEIETQIKNSKGEVVQTQKVPAELVRDGSKQTLFVNGKPFDLKQSVIDTPKGIAIDDLGKGVTAMREEGAFGLSNKQSTIETIATDLETGSQRRSLTQRSLDENANVFGGSQRDFMRPQKQITGNQQKLLSDKPQRPGEFVRTKGELADPLTSKDIVIPETRTKGARSSKAPGAAASDTQLFEGISMKLETEKVSVSKPGKPNAIDTTGEFVADNIKLLPEGQRKLYNDKPNFDKLESPAMREEREVAAVFGRDFVDNAKRTGSRSADPFDSSDLFKGSSGAFDDISQVFEQQTKQTSTKIEISKPQTPGKKSGGSQESVMINEPKTSSSTTSKVLNLDDVSLDASLGAEFSKVIPKQGVRPGIMPSFDVGNAFSQNFGFGLAIDQAQGQSQSQISGQKITNDQTFRQDTKVTQEIIQDTGFKQINDQVVSQKTIQSNAFETPMITPFAPPGLTPGVPPLRGSQSGKKIADPFAKESKKTQSIKGQYAGSLTGLVRGLKTPKDLDKLTGLEVRPIKFKRKF